MARKTSEELFEEKAVYDALHSDEVMEGLLEYAELAKIYAQTISPVGDPVTDKHSGTYRDAIEVERKGDNVYVVFGDAKSNLIEYGSIHNQEYAVRARTAAFFASIEGDTNVRVSAVAPQQLSVPFEKSRLKYQFKPTYPEPTKRRRRR
jgi:hypothetical protein